VYTGIQLMDCASPPHYLMISSSALEDPDQIFYRKRLSPFSLTFIKHAVMTLLRRKRTFQGMTIPNLLNDMDTHCITKSVVLPIEYNDGIERSSQLIEGCRNVPEVIPFCSIHPKDPEKIQKLHKYLQMGAKGLKLHPNFQRIHPNSRENFELYEAYAQYQLPLMLHSGLTGREGYFRSAKKLSSLEFIEAIPKNFPEIPIVLAHAGISQYKRGITLAQKYRNVYLELSGQPAQHIRQALSAIGPDRLLFGTDWPFWNQALVLQAVCQATTHDHPAQQCILHENAERLLRIEMS
jgi:predicted TIM-barrel fold metal-dependent hydrolase